MNAVARKFSSARSFAKCADAQERSPVLSAKARAEATVSRAIDPAKYPELYAAQVNVEIGFIANREGNLAAERAQKASGGDKAKALALMLGGL